eukprot:5047247-Alexandrium_andersonii.AAC.1
MLPADGLDAKFQVEPEMPALPPPPPVAPDSLVLNLTRTILHRRAAAHRQQLRVGFEGRHVQLAC